MLKARCLCEKAVLRFEQAEHREVGTWRQGASPFIIDNSCFAQGVLETGMDALSRIEAACSLGKFNPLGNAPGRMRPYRRASRRSGKGHGGSARRSYR